MTKHVNKSIDKRYLKTTLAACISAALLLPIAEAAEIAKTNKNKEKAMEVIEVKGYIGSLSAAMVDKRMANQIKEALVAEDLGQFSDANVAEALERISGIQITRNDSNEGQKISLRGLKETLTLINGRTSFTDSSRDVSFSDVPSESLSQIDVYKTPTASQIEGGIGGTIDMRRLQATTFKDFKAKAKVEASYSDLAEEVSPKFDFMLGNSWQTSLGDIGAVLAVSHQNRKSRFERSRAGEYINKVPTKLTDGTPITDAPAASLLSKSQKIVFGTEETDRTNIIADFDWVVNEDLSFYMDSGYSTYESEKHKVAQSVVFGNKVAAIDFSDPGLDATTVTYAKSKLNSLNQIEKRDTENFDIAIGGDYIVGRAQFSAEISHVKSNSDRITEQLQLLAKTGSADIFNVDYTDARDGYVALSTDFNITDPNNYTFDFFKDKLQETESSESAARVDVIYDLDNGIVESLEAGVRYTQRDASRFVDDLKTKKPGELSLMPELFFTDSQNFDDEKIIFPFGILSADTHFLNDNKELFLETYGIPDNSTSPKPQDTFIFDEKTLAAYVQVNLAWDIGDIPVSGNLGLRAVNTDTTSSGNKIVDGQVTPTTDGLDETHYLPSLNLNFGLTDELALRLSASRAMRRPDYDKLSPTINLNSINETGTQGNPQLKAYTADQIDASLEWYFNDNSYFATAVFYKELHNWLQSTTELQNIDGIDYEIKTNINAEEGDLKGIEISYQQFFDFLPGYFKNFGIQANVTLVDANVASPRDDVDLPLEGLSEFSYNIVGLYEQNKFSARVAWSWRDDYYYGELNGRARNRKDIGQLSAAINYKITNKLKVSLKGSNLTGSDFRSYLQRIERPEDLTQNDRRVALSLSYKF
ncbi:TonB-dependent receptor [Thalassotalea sp. ND16A]|uniref:TonB-dependent receptor n=1 Tax=Thalassotalea sp. ND16A TaxID=1535422 RepID=UPI00051A1E58|nr:TonB-dependent receptor [Thalassotalea sp. ND16A]KGK00084.1 hypothetical protein ND16A_0275 [Thalassotalea sp. ND16A]